MRPMPREPPVTSAVRPCSEKRSFMVRSWMKGHQRSAAARVGNHLNDSAARSA
jgi:hypothetical protein